MSLFPVCQAKEVLESLEITIAFLLGKGTRDSEWTHFLFPNWVPNLLVAKDATNPEPSRSQLSKLQERMDNVVGVIEKMSFDHESLVQRVSLMIGKLGKFAESWDQVLYRRYS